MKPGTSDTPVVLLLVQNLAVPFDRRVWQEALALRDAGYSVRIICPRSAEHPLRRESLEGISIYRYRPGLEARRALGYLTEYLIAIVSMLVNALRIRLRYEISVVHICNPPDLLFLVALPLKLLGARVIFDQHDAGPELVVAKGHPVGGWYERIARWAERRNFSVADVAIATNESYKVIAQTRGGMAADRVFVVRSGPTMERFANAKPNASWRQGRRYLVGYVGVMGVQDGLDHLIDTARIIIHELKREDITFVCVGSGPEFAQLRQRVDELNLTEYMRFPGRLPDAELFEMLATADVCVNPDAVNRLNDISTMNKIMDYMALGKPIVQFDLREGKVSAGESSLYADPNDVRSFANCILRLIDDAPLRTSMGKIGRQRLETGLTWETQVPMLLNAYERALNEREAVSEVPMQDASRA